MAQVVRWITDYESGKKRSEPVAVNLPDDISICRIARELVARSTRDTLQVEEVSHKTFIVVYPEFTTYVTHTDVFSHEILGEKQYETGPQAMIYCLKVEPRAIVAFIRLDDSGDEVTHHTADSAQIQLRLFEPESVDRLSEGDRVEFLATRYERDPELRRRCLEIHGTGCIACGLVMKSAYGDVAEGFIHVHHLEPLGLIQTEHVVDPRSDMVPLCPNCHAVAHLQNPPFTIAQIQQMLADRAAAPP